MIRSSLCYIKNNGSWLMLYRNRKPDDMNEGKWIGIGGKFKEGETPEECNRREVLEETGLVLRSAVFHGVIGFRSDEYEAEDMYLFSSDDFEPADPDALEEFRRTGRYDPPECDEGRLEWIEESRIFDLPTWEGDRAFLTRMLAGERKISMTLSYTGEKCTVIEDTTSMEGKMDTDLKKTCDLFIRNRNMLRDTFKWEGAAMHLIGSAVLTSHDLEPGASDLRRCAGIIKERAGWLSPLRGHMKIMLICNMLLRDDPVEYYDNVVRAHKIIRITGGVKSERSYLAAMTMSSALQHKDDLLGLADKANEIWRLLKKEPAFAADDSGYMTAAVAASSGVTDAQGFYDEMKKCLELLKDTFGNTHYTIALCSMLAIDSTDAAFKCARLREIISLLDAEGIRYGKGSELPVLASLTMLNMTNAEIARAVAEADNYLLTQEGFGRYFCSPDMRHMYAALLVLCAYSSAMQAGNMSAAAVVDEAIRSQFTAIAAGTMMMGASVYDTARSGSVLF